jgi:hypothetical protein
MSEVRLTKLLEALFREAGEEAPSGISEPNKNGEIELVRAKVRLFFDALAKNRRLTQLLQFNSPTERGEAILRFAELVGVSQGELPSLLSNLRTVATSGGEKQEEPPI